MRSRLVGSCLPAYIRGNKSKHGGWTELQCNGQNRELTTSHQIVVSKYTSPHLQTPNIMDQENQTRFPPREWLEDFRRKNPGPDPDNSLYIIKHLKNHDHAAAVGEISYQIISIYESSTPFRTYHGSTNSTRPANFHASNMVDTSNLNHVLYVDMRR